MYIIIVGGGKVGYTLAENLALEGSDVVIIDNDELTIRKVSESLDVMAVRGNGLSAGILREAGVAQADLVIAVMDSDETNIVCCLTAKHLGAKQTVARIRDPEYAQENDMLTGSFGIDLVINPELETAVKISHVLRFSSALNVETFASGRVEMVEFKLRETDSLCTRTVAEVGPKLPEPVLFCAVKRGDEVYIPSGSFLFKAGDRVYVIGKPASVTAFSRFLKRPDKRIRNVMIVGGSRIAIYLAKRTQGTGLHYKIIELSEARCARICELVPDATIVMGDGTDESILESEGIKDMDAFISLTDRDEENLMSALYALYNAIPKVIAKVNRIGNMSIINQLGIDSILSPRMLTANRIIRYVRALKNSQGSAVETLYKIVDDKAEALEFIAGEKTKHLGVPLKELTDKMRPGTLIATIVRGGRIIIPMGNDFMQSGDNVIVITREEELTDLNDIFKPGA